MPRASSASSSHCSFDSEHIPHRYINLKYCMNALQRREDITTAIHLTNHNRTMYTEILLLNHLFQSIQQTEQCLQWEKQCARYRIICLLSRKSSDQLHAWIINTNLNIPSQLPIGSPHTPPETQTPTPPTHSSHSTIPKPTQICQHTKSEIDQINHRREFLMQKFPEDQSEGTFANSITIKDDDNEEVSVLQWSEEAREELMLRFATYRRYGK
jgi:hypothetical protein